MEQTQRLSQEVRGGGGGRAGGGEFQYICLYFFQIIRIIILK